MKYYFQILVILVLIISSASCSPWKEGLISHGDENTAVENSIIDFLNSSNLSRKDSVFSININIINNDIIGIGIFGTYNKVLPIPETKIGRLTTTIPTRYIEKKGKLFYWFDSKRVLTEEMVSVLSKYKVIDSMNVDGIIGMPESYIDDSKAGVDYYFCKNNLSKYKRVTSKIAMGHYKIPKLECN